jgi:DNA-binding winged helix-turn-helix (wHTH) protein/predicted ATPase
VETGSHVEFPPFRLDLVNQELWRGRERLPLRGKPFSVLAYLATHPERLVPRDELARAVWPDTHVGEGLLRGYVRELRAVLGDDPAQPRFIETVARRGYRFVAPVRSAEPPRPAAAARAVEPRPPDLVGRVEELAELERRLAGAVAGVRQLVFVTGEAGIGKTTLVDALLRGVAGPGVWTARGQCVEHFGAGEAYLPVLEALGRLGRLPRGGEVVAVLARHAPTWLVEMPALLADAELDAVRRRVEGTTRERMLREFAEAVEVITAAQPLVLVLEDLQWSDPSTLDLLSFLARRRGPARLLVVGTYRPQEVDGRAHPLAAVKQELQVHGQCAELALPPLDADQVDEYVAARVGWDPLAPHLGRAVYRATEGNPLFVVNLVDYWTARGEPLETGASGAGCGRDAGPAAVWTGVPDTLREMIERQLDRLPAESRRVLEAASVVGLEFSTAAVAAALEERQEQVDERCEELAERELFLRSRGIDAAASGQIAGRYEFRHGLYRQVLYERLAATRCVRLHRRVGTWQEGAYGALARDRAAELALHFEQGHEPERALHHLGTAAENARRRHAYPEATALLGRALELLSRLPPTAERRRQELALRMALGASLLVTRGYTAPEVRHAYARALELCRHMEDGPELAFALAGLFRFFLLRADFKLARELSEQVLRLAEGAAPALLQVGHTLAGLPRLALADFAAARTHLEHGVALYDFEQHRGLASEHGDDPGLTSLAFLAIALWSAGLPDAALARVREAEALAARLAAPYGVTFAHTFSAWIHGRRGEAAAAEAHGDAAVRLAAEQGFAFLLAEATVLRGWALAGQGHLEAGIAQMRDGIDAQRAAGAEMGRPSHLALLADAYGKAGRAEEGLRVLEEALATVAETGERSYEADLHRLKGDLLGQLAQRAGKVGVDREAEACLQHAIAIAHAQGARSLELRAALSLARLHPAGRGAAPARRRLRDVYATFTEGFDTADLVAARGLLGAAGR